MRSRTARVIASVFACLTLGAAALVLATTEQHLATRRAAFRAFDQHAHETSAHLSDLRVAQQAYVAAGQSASFWIPKVAALLHTTGEGVDTLRSLAASQSAGQALLDASSSVTELGNIDRRARDYLAGDQALMAGDVVFTEGGATASSAAQQVESARQTERQSFDRFETTARRTEVYALSGAAGLTVLMLVLLAFAPATRLAQIPADALVNVPGLELPHDLPAAAVPPQPATPAQPPPLPDVVQALQSAAGLCTEFGKVSDAAGLELLLPRAAQLVDASGLIVWLGDVTGGDLRAIVAHGYGDEVLARIKAVPRMADNAAAAAYRSGALQVVPGTSANPLGAIVAPILSSEGCIGALTAETHHNSERSATAQALVSIFAAQLAGVLAGSTAAASEAPSPRAASA